MARMGCRGWGASALVVVALSVAALPANATVMVEVPLEDMARDADAVIRGVVERAGVQMVLRKGGLEPESVAQIRVLDWVGTPSGDRDLGEHVVVRELGGEWRGGGAAVIGTPHYRQGEEVLLFLRRHPEVTGNYRTYAMAQGKFVILRGAPGVPALARRELEGLGFARWAGGRMTVEHLPEGPAVQLRQLLDLVRQVRGYGADGSASGVLRPSTGGGGTP